MKTWLKLIIPFSVLATSSVEGYSATMRTIFTEDPSWPIDPAGVRSIETHHFITAIAPTLLERDRRTRQVTNGIAKRFYWEGNDLIFELRRDYKSIDGSVAKADDVIFSLKRLFNSRENVAMPGRLDQYLCPDKKDPLDCKNLQKIDDYKIRMKFPMQSAAYLEFLTDPVYSIVLEKTVEKASGKITDLKNTLGPYYIEYNRPKEILLKINPNHWKYSKDYATEIILKKLVNATDKNFSEQAVDLLLNNEVDFVGVSPRLSLEQFEKVQSKLGKKGSYFVSDELNARFLLFSNKGMKIPVEKRQLISKMIQENVNSIKKKLGNFKRPTTEFLLSGTFGSFTLAEFQRLDQMRASMPSRLPENFTFTVGVKSKVWQEFLDENLLPFNSNVKFISTSKSIDEIIRSSEGDDVPDLVPISSDIATIESFKTIGFFVDRKVYNIRDEAEGARWIQKYTSIYDADQRNNLYRQLHFDSVATNPSIIPMYTTPFRAIATNGWSIEDFPAHVPGDYFWKIKKKRN